MRRLKLVPECPSSNSFKASLWRPREGCDGYEAAILPPRQAGPAAPADVAVLLVSLQIRIGCRRSLLTFNSDFPFAAAARIGSSPLAPALEGARLMSGDCAKNV